MKQTLNLDDALLLLAVADGAGLAGAARTTGISVPTLGRRMTALENAIGRKLFERGARGYTLTADGRAFASEARSLRHTAARLAAIGADQGPVPVRLTAGVWTSRFVAQHLPPDANRRWAPEFLSSVAMIDVARREADIGIRNRRPNQPWLAGRRTATIEFALYAKSADVIPVVTRPIGPSPTPSERWLRDTLPDAPRLVINEVRLGLDLALAGHARVVLPTFIGANTPGLIPLCEPIKELTHDEWIVCHHDARNDPPVRAALDTVTQILTNRALRS